jgi:hypothetical protein
VDLSHHRANNETGHYNDGDDNDDDNDVDDNNDDNDSVLDDNNAAGLMVTSVIREHETPLFIRRLFHVNFSFVSTSSS